MGRTVCRAASRQADRQLSPRCTAGYVAIPPRGRAGVTPGGRGRGGAAEGGQQHPRPQLESWRGGGGRDRRGCHQPRCPCLRVRRAFVRVVGSVAYPPGSSGLCLPRPRFHLLWPPPPPPSPPLPPRAVAPLVRAESARRWAPREPICGSDPDGTAVATAVSCEHVPPRALAGGCPPNPPPRASPLPCWLLCALSPLSPWLGVEAATARRRPTPPPPWAVVGAAAVGVGVVWGRLGARRRTCRPALRPST